MVNEINENIFLVNAPAGSGKTTTIRKMVDKHLRTYKEDNILCITYTNRAAEELGKDIDSDRVFFGTIHSFINHFISSFFSHKAVIDLYWEIYKEKIQERIENIDDKENVKESNQRYIEKYGQLDIETVYNNIDNISYNVAPYNSLYRGALSHDDLISFTKRMVDKFPVIKRKIADKYQLIFIDEYQDTSADVLYIFYEAMKNSKGSMYLLGDKMQQIYKTYDGTFESKFLTLNRSFNLKTNYRTTPRIVSILNNIYNVEEYNQCAFSKKSNSDMDYPPEVIITESVETVLAQKKQKYADMLILYLLNRDRFYSIGAQNLYDAVYNMGKYAFGKKYSVVDVLTKKIDDNPDKLFKLLFLFWQINGDYERKLYGKVIRTIKENERIFNVSRYTIKRHEDKKKIDMLLQQIFYQFNKDASVMEFLLLVKQLDMVDSEYLDEIMGDEEYNDVLEVSIKEFHKLSDYLQNPHISTQHGVKGESHDTVAFIAADSKQNPVVHMSKFFKLWSMTEINLPEFEKIYYRYKKLIIDIETIVGMKCADLKKDDYACYEEEIYKEIYSFQQEYNENNYFKYLLKDVIDKYLQKKGVTNARNCLKENLVYGSLSAYRLFYVGCSRARKNLSIIIDRNDIKEFEEKLVAKFKKCGFTIVKK
ncbi:MAG: ATP-dependent helicase [Lachnospiraceae bacterium]